MTPLILIADDDVVQRRLLETMARRAGYATESVGDGAQALARLEAIDRPPLALAILDLVMPELDGMAVLEKMRGQKLSTPAIVTTAAGSTDSVVSAMRAGAHDFLVKPVGPERFLFAVKNVLRLGALEREFRRIDRGGALAPPREFSAGSEDMIRVARLAERAAKSHIPVLIEGEAGVGKDFLARALHAASERRNKPLVKIDCAGLDPERAESELFGDGATPGCCAAAQGGVLLLDSVDALPAQAQARLARLLQDGEILQTGARRALRLDARLIATTRRALIEEVRAGRFREDLYYRLNVFPISIPPLRARRVEIVGLAQDFLARFSAEEAKNLRGVSAEALALLCAYDWPGNIRQLENAMFRAVALAEGDEATLAEFPQIAARVDGFELRIPAAPVFAPAAPNFSAATSDPQKKTLNDPHLVKLLDENGEARRLDWLEEQAIRFALAHYRGQMSEMARRLGIGRSTLYRKLRDFGLADHDGLAAPDAA